MTKNYIFKKTDDNPSLFSECWKDVEKAELDNTNFCGKDAVIPKVTAQAVCTVYGVTVRFESDEKNPTMRYSHANQPAWLDSCVEFFFAPFKDKQGTYLNFEQSVGGALLIQKGTNASDRKYIPHGDDEFRTERKITDNGWAIQFFIPFSFMDKHFETTERDFKGNFQFCNEEKDVYLTWNKIENPTPAFHKSEYFGDLHLGMNNLELLWAECIKYGYKVYNICEYTTDGITSVELEPNAFLHHCYSVTKCVISIMIGMLQDRKMISVEDKVADYLSDYFPEDVDPKWYEVRIKDVLHHRNGGSGGGLFNKHKDMNIPGDKDLLTYIFMDKLPAEIGKDIVYCDSNYYIISRIIEKITGMKADEWALQNLFNPLHFEFPAWARCPQGHTLGGDGLCLCTRDLGKLGWVYANHGKYEDKQIISEDWIRQAMDVINVDEHGDYGFAVQHCNYMKDDEYYLVGAGDQTTVFRLGRPHAFSFHACGAGGYMGLLKKAMGLLRADNL